MGRKPVVQSELNAHQRAGSVTMWLILGNRLTTADIARLTHMTWDGAKYMMDRLSISVPIDCDDDGYWFYVKSPPSP